MADHSPTTQLWLSFVHNCIAHPLLFFTGGSRIAWKLHDWSAPNG